jgi:hypothetical protein
MDWGMIGKEVRNMAQLYGHGRLVTKALENDSGTHVLYMEEN